NLSRGHLATTASARSDASGTTERSVLGSRRMRRWTFLLFSLAFGCASVAMPNRTADRLRDAGGNDDVSLGASVASDNVPQSGDEAAAAIAIDAVDAEIDRLLA